MPAQREASSHQDQKGGCLDCRGKQLRTAAPADSAPLQEKKYADDADRNHRFMSREGGKKIAAVLGYDNGDRGGRAARPEPVAPSDDEARVFSDGTPRKIVLATAARNRGSEFGERGCAEERVHSADDPDADEQPDVWQHLGDVARSAHDARTNGIANCDGNPEPHAEHLE